MAVGPEQRFTRTRPCPVCGGFDGAPRGRGVRCAGFVSADGEWCRCTREELAGNLQLDTRTAPPTYPHRLRGECRCGAIHGPEQGPPPIPHRSRPSFDVWSFTETYPYQDQRGELLFEVCRYASPDKTFRQRRPTADLPDSRRPDHWRWDVQGVAMVPYRLPALLAADPAEPVFIVEGERDVHTAERLNLVATTAPGGAGKWRDDYCAWFQRRRAVIIPDNDDPGHLHAGQVARSLRRAGSEAPLILDLPNLPPAGDLTDWVAAGGTREALLELLDRAPRPAAMTSPDEFTAVGDLLDEPDEEHNWLVDGLLLAGGTSLLVAKPKTGKSILAQNLSVAVGQGVPFLRRDTHQGTVLYLALEEKRAEVRRHFRLLGSQRNDPLYVYCASVPEDAMTWLRNAVKVYQPVLIVVDTLQRLTRLGDINDYGTVSNALEPLQALARTTGAHLLLSHHGNKRGGSNGDEVLGSTALYAAVDTLITLQRREERRTLRTFQRYADDLPESILEMDPETFQLSLTELCQDSDPRDMADQILAFLDACSHPVGERDVEGGVEGRTAVMRSALRTLVQQKRVMRTGAGHRGSPYLYSRFPVFTTIQEQENEEHRAEPINGRLPFLSVSEVDACVLPDNNRVPAAP